MRAFRTVLLAGLILAAVLPLAAEVEITPPGWIRDALVTPPRTAADYSYVRAIVQNVDRYRCPYTRLVLRVTYSSNPYILDLRGGVGTLVVSNYFWRFNNRINPCERRNAGAFAAWYLLPGDEIRAKVFPGSGPPVVGGRWYVYGITRVRTVPLRQALSSTRAVRGVQVTLSVSDEQFDLGEPVTMNLFVINTAQSVRALHFVSGRQYDFVVLRDGVEVWRWSEGKFFTQALTSYTLSIRVSREIPSTSIFPLTTPPVTITVR